MFPSYGRNSANNPTVDRFARLPDDGADEMADPLENDYRARHVHQDAETAPLAGSGEVKAASNGVTDEWDGPDDFRLVVRPYTWTRGRTRPVQDLALETLVSTSDEGRDLSSICSAEHAAIARLCTDILSVAEVAALLTLPLGVARVLLADMIDAGLVHVHRNATGWGSAPDLSLLERVLDGLYRL